MGNSRARTCGRRTTGQAGGMMLNESWFGWVKGKEDECRVKEQVRLNKCGIVGELYKVTTITCGADRKSVV